MKLAIRSFRRSTREEALELIKELRLGPNVTDYLFMNHIQELRLVTKGQFAGLTSRFHMKFILVKFEEVTLFVFFATIWHFFMTRALTTSNILFAIDFLLNVTTEEKLSQEYHVFLFLSKNQNYWHCKAIAIFVTNNSNSSSGVT